MYGTIAVNWLRGLCCAGKLLTGNDPVRANQTRLPALGLLPLEFC
jgi:hypothetical protein